MLKSSVKFGTELTVGPRLQKLVDAGYSNILWEENYPNQEDATNDGRGQFQHTRESIEIATLSEVFDLWCRGQDLSGYSDMLLHATATFRKAIET